MKKYLIELTLLQRMQVSGMKAKQSTEPSVVAIEIKKVVF